MTETTTITRRGRARVAGPVVLGIIEVFVLAEILWYYLHDGEQTLHGAFGEWWEGAASRARWHCDVEDTLDHIRDLPETETE